MLDALRHAIAHAYSGTSYYRARCDSAGLTPRDLRSLDDLRRFPFTLKSDFRDHYPFGMLAVPREKLIRIHASSGTTGKPTIVGYTRGDLDLWHGLVARNLEAAGARPGDLLHNAYGYGLFTGGLGFHGGAERLGCTVVPASGGQTERQVQLILDLKPRILCCTPSYALVLAEALERSGVDPRGTSLEIGMFGAEPWSDEMQRAIEQRLGIAALDVYGLSEVLGPGVAQERPSDRGALTIWDDHFFPEVVDPASGAPVGNGEIGELVLTTLTKEALPVIRYRTGDLTRLHPPRDGDTFRRMARLLGRSDDMLIVRGVNIFPRQIEELILEDPALTPHYRIDVRREGTLDRLHITVEGREGHSLGHRMKSHYGLSASVEIVEPGTLPRSEGKAKRVFDHRK
ncbi:MAG: AMP-binding protein [Alphaproteobacteria bacterium]|nr:AMP-binding protein [Alphaproteobacteria bacterium]MBV9695170.1 AMP-binding protein [Alphaproteobacteria bacterium]